MYGRVGGGSIKKLTSEYSIGAAPSETLKINQSERAKSNICSGIESPFAQELVAF